MVIREDEDTIVSALSRIAEAIEDNSDILKGIKAHYDGVVPVMTRNAKRAEELQTKEDKDYLESIANQEAYNIVNSNYVSIQAKAKAESEKVSTLNARASKLIKEIEDDALLSPVEKAEKIAKIQSILGQ